MKSIILFTSRGGSSSQSTDDRKVNLQQDLEDKRMAICTQILVITLPKKGKFQLCQNYKTISLIRHPSKVAMKIIFNRLQPQAEEITAEDQAGFRAGSSTTISNLQILCSINKILTMSSYISKRPLTGYGLKHYEELWGNAKLMPASYELLKIYMTRPRVQYYFMIAQETGSELQSESYEGVYSQEPSLTYF